MAKINRIQIGETIYDLEDTSKVPIEEGKGLSTNDYTDEEKQKVADAQPKLVSGTNIKTVNGQSLLGEGNLDIDLSLFKVVASLPEEDIDQDKIYLVLDSTATEGNTYKEYVYVNGEWELLGEYKAAVDLTPYMKTSDADSKYLSKTDAGSTYLSQEDAESTYLSQEDAADAYQAKGDYATNASVNEKQSKSDSSLETEAKTIVGAINEVAGKVTPTIDGTTLKFA